MNPHFTSILLLLFSALLIFQTGCTPTGAAIGAGASVGVSAAREGGIKSTTNDLRIKAFISDKWFKYNLETFAKLNVTVNQGRVLITGVVQNPEDRVEAVRLTWQVEGVNQVINEIQIAESAGFKSYVRDQWITAQLRTKLTFDRDIQSINYSIDTVRGIIYLMGIAQNQHELNKVIEQARTVSHVTQVVSYVKMAGNLKPETRTSDNGAVNWNDQGNLDNDMTQQEATASPATLTPVSSENVE